LRRAQGETGQRNRKHANKDAYLHAAMQAVLSANDDGARRGLPNHRPPARGARR
jgi:hypothetical protein